MEASTAISAPEKAAGSRTTGNDCRGWKLPTARPASAGACNGSSPSAPLRWITADPSGSGSAASSAASGAMAGSGTARKSRAPALKGIPDRQS